MQHFSFIVNEHSINTELQRIKEASLPYKSVLIQVYSAETDPSHYQKIATILLQAFAHAIIVGASTVGEIIGGITLNQSSVVGITFFEKTQLVSIDFDAEKTTEIQIAKEVMSTFDRQEVNIAAALLLTTPLTLDVSVVLKELKNRDSTFPIFGGGAGDYGSMQDTLLLHQNKTTNKGIVLIVFLGDELHVKANTYLGWRVLSQEMRVTEADGMTIKTIDNLPAFDVYTRYLGTPYDENFFLNALEFPLMVRRNNEYLARVVVGVTVDHGLQLVADVKEGEVISIGYGDPQQIVDDSQVIQHQMALFSPEVIFLYSCGCRRFLMQEDTNLETKPLEAIAPTFGFYTYGEYLSDENHNDLLNSTMVVVAMREGESNRSPINLFEAKPYEIIQGGDPYLHKHARVVSALVRFISTVTEELEKANKQLYQLSITDKLTQAFNREHLDVVLQNEMNRSLQHNIALSVILLDIDHFKQVNDTFGHIVGDQVLIRFANILRHHIRPSDTLGRWGGEEFLVILPNTDLETAVKIAETLRHEVSVASFETNQTQTVSLGVASLEPLDSITQLVARADAGLYDAKNLGRNRVSFTSVEKRL